MQIMRPLEFAALGMGAAFTVLWGVADPMAAYAEVRTIEADGYYLMGDGLDESPAVAKERAKADALRAASEKAGVFVESLSEVKSGVLTKDEVKAISSAVMEVQDSQVFPEVVGDQAIRYRCHVTVKVDTESVTAQLQRDRLELDEAVQKNKELEARTEQVAREMETLKIRYANAATDSERELIRLEVKQNEQHFAVSQWVYEGNKRYYSKDYPGAVEAYRKAIEANPEDGYAYNNLGLAYSDMNDDRKAIECYEKALSLGLQHEYVYNNMGVSYANLDDYPTAIQQYRKALSIRPDYWICKLNMARAYAVEVDAAKGLELCRELQAEGHDFAFLQMTMGTAYARMEQYENALKCFDKALETVKDNPKLYYMHGLCNVGLGRFAESLSDFQQTLKLDPSDGQAMYYMGRSYYLTGEPAKALDMYRKAIAKGYDSPELQGNCGLAYSDLEQYKEAIDCFDKALASIHDSAILYVKRGMCYAFLDRNEEALADCERALEIDPSLDAVRQARDMLKKELGR